MEQKIEENVIVEKKIFIFSLFLLTILIISSILLSYLLLSNKIMEMNKIEQITEPDIPAYENIENDYEEELPIVYILKEYNGKIGVYENNALIYTLDTYVFTLPEMDKQLLRDGIVISDKNELLNLIEEYY